MSNNIIRQGDVILVPVSKLPAGLKPVPLDNGRIVLAYGEVTGHAHAIADHGMTMTAAGEIVAKAIRKAQLFSLSNGQRFLEVSEPVNLTHEEHTAHLIPPGLYEVPIQVDMTADKLPRRVAD